MSTVLDERDIALEIAEAAPAPGVIAEFMPQPEHVPAEPMTQRRVLGLATPIIGENLLQTAVGAVDTFMVARLGAAAVAGVGTGFEIVFFIISILSAIDIGATVLVSQAIGARLERLAGSVQVLAITHAPQVAARASHHFLIGKDAVDGGKRVVTEVTRLDDTGRGEEVARMLAGASVTDEARAAARRLMQDADADG